MVLACPNLTTKMKMHRTTKSLGFRISHRFCGALFCAAACSVSVAPFAHGQIKSITPDPYFGGSQATVSPVKKPFGLSSGWQAPTNLGVDSSRNPSTDGSAKIGNAFQPDSTAVKKHLLVESTGAVENQQQKNTFAMNESSQVGNAFKLGGQTGVRTANVGSQTKSIPEQTLKPRAKSLIVQTGGQSASQGSGSGSRSSVRQIDHQTDSANEPFKPSKVLALVGGEPIFVGDLMFQINQVIEEKMGGAPEKIKEQQRQMAIPQLLPQFVESKLLYQGAIRGLPDGVDLEGIFAQVEQQFEETALQKMMDSAGVKSVAEFDARLRGQDYSLRQLKRNWAIQQFTRHSIGQTIGSVPETTHQEMLDRYKQNLASYEKPARAKWEQILVRFDRTNSRAEAKRAIVEVGNQIVHGANFAATAKKQSHGFNAASGGVHDWTTQGALALEEIDEALFSLPVGELSDLIETKRGFHIVRVVERTAANRTPFLEAQIEIKKRIEGEKRKVAFDKYVKKLREEIPVEYLVNE